MISTEEPYKSPIQQSDSNEKYPFNWLKIFDASNPWNPNFITCNDNEGVGNIEV